MFINSYKIKDDGKWHLWDWTNLKKGYNITDCGKIMDVIERRTIGQNGDEYFPDPPVSDVCPKCFPFITEKL
jgi:hypothetical protein